MQGLYLSEDELVLQKATRQSTAMYIIPHDYLHKSIYTNETRGKQMAPDIN